MKFFTIFRTTKKVKAFTLLETMASFVIITVVVLGPLTTAINSASYTGQSKDIMTATYLAEEAIELLHNQYDTLVLLCGDGSLSPCTTLSLLSGETSADPGKPAWRILKTRLQSGSQDCFSASGCSFDFRNLVEATTTAPVFYSPIANQCSPLTQVISNVSGGKNRYHYLCDVLDHATVSVYGVFDTKPTMYTRKINVESLNSYNSCDPSTCDPVPMGFTPVSYPGYHDDLRVTASVSMRRTNGTIRTIQVVDFLHIK